MGREGRGWSCAVTGTSVQPGFMARGVIYSVCVLEMIWLHGCQTWTAPKPLLSFLPLLISSATYGM